MILSKTKINSIYILLIIGLSSVFSGCASHFTSAPMADGHLTDSLVKTYSEISLDSIYAQGNKGQAERNIEINKLLTLSEHNYQEFRNKFYAGNAETQLGFDWISLGLSTAGALSTGGAAPILSGVSAAVQGAQGKFNSRFFLEKTTETLVNGMDTLRATKKQLIIAKMANLDINEYSTEEGVRDVLDYHAAGSLVSALVLVAAESGQAKQTAETELKVTEDELAGIRNTTFTDTKEGQLLQKFRMPDGVNIDSKNEARIRDWMDRNGLKDQSPTIFMTGDPRFDRKRKKAVHDLNLTNN
ncbi:hypothetical protein [Methylomonas fluvii]|uniref:Lipoprotein n=1 Tax=Methylomonas fluvii TaxID=1854564 RepID=A0ABR9DHM3_9GAMM|nr:hypothetical protein [Methylomonas fluvii]MBD9362607.1 hypothetical protein [Methylomonas fluvii]